MKCALLQNNVVVDIQDIGPDDIAALSSQYSNIVDLTNADVNTGIGWVFNGSTCVSPDPVQASLPDKKLTKLALRNRLTMTEKITIESQTATSAPLRAWLADFTVSTFIDLNRADTVSGIQYLETAGIIGAGRADVIINQPIADSERYKG